MDKKQALMAVAITALVGIGSSSLRADDAAPAKAAAKMCEKVEKNSCKGKNECKGKSAAGEANECGGKGGCAAHVQEKEAKGGKCPKGFHPKA